MANTWMQHTFRDRSWRLQRQAVALGALGLFVAIMMGALYLAQSASVATLGRELEDVIARRNALEQVNEQLRAEISQLRSVPRLLARAQELGFAPVQDNQVEYLFVETFRPQSEVAVPVLQGAAAPAENAPEYDESFAGWLEQQWDSLIGQFQGFSGGDP